MASDTVGWTSDGEIIRRMLNLCMFEGRCVTYIYCPFFCRWDFNVFNWEELRASCSRACVIWKSQISDIFIFIIIVIFVIVITSLFSLFIYSMPIHLAIPISPSAQWCFSTPHEDIRNKVLHLFIACLEILNFLKAKMLRIVCAMPNLCCVHACEYLVLL